MPTKEGKNINEINKKIKKNSKAKVPNLTNPKPISTKERKRS